MALSVRGVMCLFLSLYASLLDESIASLVFCSFGSYRPFVRLVMYDLFLFFWGEFFGLCPLSHLLVLNKCGILSDESVWFYV